jgi:hypothetical protein
MEASLTPFLTMLNLTTVFIVVSLGGASAFLIADGRWWFYATTLVGGLLLARLFYLAAVLQAENYGSFIRVAFDLHRSKILKQMRIPLPPNLEAERSLWGALNLWLLQNIPPWESDDASQYPAMLGWPFNYEITASTTKRLVVWCKSDCDSQPLC